jgi:hypothetical protein
MSSPPETVLGGRRHPQGITLTMDGRTRSLSSTHLSLFYPALLGLFSMREEVLVQAGRPHRVQSHPGDDEGRLCCACELSTSSCDTDVIGRIYPVLSEEIFSINSERVEVSSGLL